LSKWVSRGRGQSGYEEGGREGGREGGGRKEGVEREGGGREGGKERERRKSIVQLGFLRERAIRV
jgi:hypothetical protein